MRHLWASKGKRSVQQRKPPSMGDNSLPDQALGALRSARPRAFRRPGANAAPGPAAGHSAHVRRSPATFCAPHHGLPAPDVNARSGQALTICDVARRFGCRRGDFEMVSAEVWPIARFASVCNGRVRFT